MVVQADNMLPCPFCGAPGELFHDMSSDYERNWYWHGQCSDYDGCWIEGASADTKKEAIRLWNRRWSPDSRAEAIDRVVEFVRHS